MPDTRTRRNLRFLLALRPHIHILFESGNGFNMNFFRWIGKRHPEASRYFRFSLLGEPASHRFPRGRLLVPWFQDPVRERSVQVFEALRKVEYQYQRARIDVINPAEALSNCIKLRALDLARQAGIRCAHTVPCDSRTGFEHLADELGTPFIIRSNHGHALPMYLVDSADGLQSVDWKRLGVAVASEFIDVRSDDGFYRKYRYLMFGDQGMGRHLIVSENWWVHAADRLRKPAFLAEEQRYLSSDRDRFHTELDRYRRLLGLDFVAFDYSVDSDGRMVLWEPNPFPVLWSRFNREDSFYEYQQEHMDRVYTMHLNWLMDRARLAHSLR